MKFNDWLGFFSLIVCLVILWQFRQILLLVFTAVIIATALNSIVRFLGKKFKLSRAKSILITLVGLLLVSTLFILFIIPPFITQFQELIKLIPVGFQQFVFWANSFLENPPAWFPELNLKLLPNLGEIYQKLSSLAPHVFSNFFAIFSSSTAILLELLLILVITLMLLGEPLAYRRLLLQLFPSSYRGRADEILS